MIRKKVMVLVAMICLMVGAFPICVFADDSGEPVVEPNNAYSITTSAGLSISASGTATATAKITGMPGVTTKMTCTMSLQKKSGDSWTTLKSWNDSTTGMVLSLSGKKSVSKGKYRVHAVFHAYAGKKSEKITKNTKTVAY